MDKPTNRRQAQLLLKNRFQQLDLIMANKEEFEENDGKRGVQERINTILDEINFLRNYLKNN